MKYIFWTLLFANLAYFGYGMTMKNPTRPDIKSVESVVDVGQSATAITLISEAAPKTGQNKALAKVVNNPLSHSPVEGEQCKGVGPIAELFAGQAIKEKLDAIGLQAVLKALDTNTGDSDYRVVLPAARSAEEAFRKLRELQAAKIDSYVITQGELALAISLGVFSTKVAATQLIEKVEQKGYPATLIEIQRQNREFWLFVPAESDLPQLNSPFWQQILEENPGLEQRTSNCPKNTSPDV